MLICGPLRNRFWCCVDLASLVCIRDVKGPDVRQILAACFAVHGNDFLRFERFVFFPAFLSHYQADPPLAVSPDVRGVGAYGYICRAKRSASHRIRNSGPAAVARVAGSRAGSPMGLDAIDAGRGFGRSLCGQRRIPPELRPIARRVSGGCVDRYGGGGFGIAFSLGYWTLAGELVIRMGR